MDSMSGPSMSTGVPKREERELEKAAQGGNRPNISGFADGGRGAEFRNEAASRKKP